MLEAERITDHFQEKDLILDLGRIERDPDQLAIDRDLKLGYYLFLPISGLYYFISLIVLIGVMSAL